MLTEVNHFYSKSLKSNSLLQSFLEKERHPYFNGLHLTFTNSRFGVQSSPPNLTFIDQDFCTS